MFDLAPTYLLVRWRIQSYVVLGKMFVCWLILFMKNGLVALGRKHLLKKRQTHTWAMVSVWEKKLNAHEHEKNKSWWAEIDFKLRTNIWLKAKCLPRFRIFGEASGVYEIFPFSLARKKFYYFWFIKNLIEKRILWTWSRWGSRVPYSGKRRVSTQVFLFSVD